VTVSPFPPVGKVTTDEFVVTLVAAEITFHNAVCLEYVAFDTEFAPVVPGSPVWSET
jgi:hypothetical protein